MVSTKIDWRGTEFTDGTPASPMRCAAESNSEKIAVPPTVPAFVETVAKPLTRAPGLVETSLRVAPGGSENVNVLEVIVDPVSSVSVIDQEEPAADWLLLSTVKTIVPLAVPVDAGFVRNIVVLQV
jgi:hypothetical protein